MSKSSRSAGITSEVGYEAEDVEFLRRMVHSIDATYYRECASIPSSLYLQFYILVTLSSPSSLVCLFFTLKSRQSNLHPSIFKVTCIQSYIRKALWPFFDFLVFLYILLLIFSFKLVYALTSTLVEMLTLLRVKKRTSQFNK